MRRVPVPLPGRSRRSGSPRCRRAPRGAFTLLEVLLALALSVAVMAGVYSAMSLYRRAATAGRVEMERDQLARAILRRIALDVRSVVYRDPLLEGSRGPSGSALAGGQAAEFEPLQGELAIGMEGAMVAGQAVGVYGMSDWLVLHVSRPSRVPTQSDLKSVTYALGMGRGAGLAGQLVPGLNRLEGDLLTMSLADQRADTAMLAAHAQVLAEEVQWIEFQYFDGMQWHPSWDSDLFFGPPQAISIRIGLAPLEGEPVGTFRSVTASPEVYRLVVPVPVAPPFVGMFP